MFLIRGTIDFQIEVIDAKSEAEAREVITTMEPKIAPRFDGMTDILDFNVEIEEVEDTDD